MVPGFYLGVVAAAVLPVLLTLARRPLFRVLQRISPKVIEGEGGRDTERDRGRSVWKGWRDDGAWLGA